MLHRHFTPDTFIYVVPRILLLDMSTLSTTTEDRHTEATSVVVLSVDISYPLA